MGGGGLAGLNLLVQIGSHLARPCLGLFLQRPARHFERFGRDGSAAELHAQGADHLGFPGIGHHREFRTAGGTAEEDAEGALGVFFGCPSCGAKFSMVTNPGETQMVSSLGVQLGGRTVAAEPFEMTRGTLRAEGPGQAEMANYLKEHYGDKPVSTTATESSEKKSGCPFSAVVAQM